MHTIQSDETLKLLAPNRYVLNHVKQNLLQHIQKTVLSMNIGIHFVQCEIGSHVNESMVSQASTDRSSHPTKDSSFSSDFSTSHKDAKAPYEGGRINRGFTFANHVEGVSNQLARAAAQQVGENPGLSYNPLFIYGGVGLGKTHLMQAAGNLILDKNPRANVVYIRSELFVNDMVKALKNNTMNEFKRYYRSIDTLLIDDIQFFARKTQSQVWFRINRFH